ncbi:MAG: Gfo/Idh/MocA family oxidoreductase, partial [Rhodothermaceae bacterium]|nr:Gfo/Idh/MocA family oxidoreductase [Rhodothermaceae bacterium]
RAYTSAATLLAEADAVCVAAPTMDHFLLARTAVAQGAHVFLDWPLTTSLSEAEQLAQFAEEAGVEIGVARPLPVTGLLAARPDGWRPRLATMTLVGSGHDATQDGADLPWPQRIAGLVGLALALAGSADVQRLDAEADRGAGARLHAVVFSLRFRNGTLVHAHLREGTPAPEDAFRLDASGQGLRVSARALRGPLIIESQDSASLSDAGPRAMPSRTSADTQELTAFIEAIAAGQQAPVSILDGLRTMRLVEQVMERLR